MAVLAGAAVKPRALTDMQVAFVQRITAQRRQAMKAAREFPTNADIAEQLGCCQRLIDRISAGHVYKVSVSHEGEELRNE